MRVLVTGGAGFIGSNLSKSLIDDDLFSKVTVVDDLSTGSLDNIRQLDGIEFVEGSILDADLMMKLVSESDSIVHLAARPSVPRSISDPRASHDVNVNGTINILEAARAKTSLPHLIFASSSSVYGANPIIPKQELQSTVPLSPYAASKLASEGYCVAYQNSFGIPVLAFRFFNVFGPHQKRGHAYAAVVPSFVGAALDDEPAAVHGDGAQTRDFTYVGTVVTTIRQALIEKITHPHAVNLAFGSRHSLLELLSMIEEIFERPVKRNHEQPRTGDVRDSQADCTLLKSLFPSIEPVPLRAGLAETIAWMKSVN